MAELSRESIEAIDPQGMLGVVLEQPDHLTDALWRVESAGLAPQDAPGGFAVCGMGGSAIGADLAAAAIGDRARKPMVTVRDYTLPSYVDETWLVLCASYSGNTEETLSAFEAAGAAGAKRIALTTGGELARGAREGGVPVIGAPGGLQPRAAVAYMTVCSLEAAAAGGVCDSLRAEVEAACALERRLLEEWGPDAPSGAESKAIAHRLTDKVTMVHGNGLTDPVALRWKTQINENAKAPAFHGTLPEADHNEICGFDRGREFADFGVVFLADRSQHERNRARLELTARKAEEGKAAAIRVESRGETRLERVMSLVLLGDLVSVYLAALANVDPTPVEVIEGFKRELG